MGTTIIFRRGENDPTSGSGLTLAEPAFNTTLKTFHIGLGHGVTAAWVGGPISGLSADIAAGITYKTPTASAVKNYIAGLCFGNTGAATITQYVSSFNGLTGAVGGVCAAQANTFTALQSFASGISASGITVGGNMTVTGNLTVSGGVTFTASETVLIEDNIITLNSNVTGSPSENAGVEIERGTSANVQLLWNESSDKWTFTNDGSTYYDLPTSVVTSFNGLTGAMQGVSAAVAGTGISVSGATGTVTITNTGVQSFNGNTGAVTGASLGANTFTGLNSFNAGISSFGGTFSGNIVQFLSGLSAALVRTSSIEPSGSNPVTFADNKFRFTVLGFPSSFYTTLQAEPTTSADRTVTLPDASGTVALTSQLMGAVNGSTAATTAVTSFNGRTGAVQGVSAAVAGTGISVSGATGAVTITNTGVQSFNGLTGAVTGASLGANTFTELNSFNAGISAAGGTFSALTRFTAGISASGGMTLGGSLQGSTATFTGNVTGITFIGGLSGNATGIIINATSSSSELFPVLCTSTTSTVARADTTAPRVSIIPSTGQLTAPIFRVASTASGGSFTEITDAGIITANGDLTLRCDGNILSLGDVDYITNGCKIVIDNSGGSIDVDAIGSPLTLTGSPVSVNGQLDVTAGISAAGGATFGGLVRFTSGISAAGGTFSALTRFTAGISAAGGMTLGGSLQGSTATFSGLLSASAGISAAGTTAATFGGTVNFNSNTAYKPTLQYYNEPYAVVGITGNGLTLDLSTSQVFGVTLNSPINTLTISNTPSTANRSIGFTLILTADGTPRGITWGNSIKWSGAVSPTLTSTNGKKDVFTFVSINGGSEWLGFIAGQNF